MRGTVVRREKTWSYVVDVGRKPDGKRRQVWKGRYRTKRDAEADLTKYRHRLATGGNPFPNDQTVQDYVVRWLEHQRTRLRPHPYRRYAQVVRDHIVPVIGALPLTSVRPAHVQQLLDAVAGKGLAPRSVIETRAILSSAFRQAVAWGLLTVNPVSAVRPPKSERRELAIPTTRQLVALMDAARGTAWEVPLLLPSTTGARRGEVLAVRWADIDLTKGRLRITRSLQRSSDREGRGTALVLMEPKTDGARREVALTGPTIERLRRHRQEQAARRLAFGPSWHDGDLVCDRGDGLPLDPDAFSHAFKRLAVAAGVDCRTRLHDVRHAVATTMLEGSVHPAIASAVLGHASPAFTMSVYQHVLDGMTAVAASAVEDALAVAGQRAPLAPR